MKEGIDTILIEGTFFAPSGYSSATREFTHHFIQKYRDDYKNIFLIDRQWDNIKMTLDEKYNDTILEHLVKENKQIQNVVPDNAMILRWGIPTAFDNNGFEDVPHRIKAIYFVWECDRLPALWVDNLVYYDVIFTSSKASARSIRRSLEERNLDIPVEIIPHGVADHYYKYEDKNKTLDGFTFLHVGTFSMRKANMEMIQAYLNEFKSSDGVRLVWKIGSLTNYGQILTIKREIQRMAFNMGIDMVDAPKIVLDMNTYNHDLMNELYNEADCLILVSRGEAWGLPILNAMATGTPSITLEKGGHRSFCTKKTTFFVKKTNLIYAEDKNNWYSIAHAVKWWDFDMDDYQKVMRDVYENRDKISEKSEACLETAKKFNWNNVVNRAYKIFNKYDKQIVSRYERDQ